MTERHGRRQLLVELCAVLGAATWLNPGSANARTRASVLATRPDVVVEASVDQIELIVTTAEFDRVEVITASLPSGFTATVRGNARRVQLEVSGVGVPSSGRVELRVPKRARLRLQSRASNIALHNVHGQVRVGVVAGDISIDGAPEHVKATTTSGDIRVAGVRDEADLATVSGNVIVTGGRGKLEANAVSGNISVSSCALDRSTLSVVSGTIELESTVGPGSHELVAHSGDIGVTLPPTESVTIRARTFSGTIVDTFVDPAITASHRHERVLGEGVGRIDVRTFGGNVRLSPKRAD